METKSYSNGDDHISLSSYRSQTSKQSLFRIEDSEKGTSFQVQDVHANTKTRGRSLIRCTVMVTLVIAISAILSSFAVLSIDQVQLIATTHRIQSLMDQLQELQQNVSNLTTTQDVSGNNLDNLQSSFYRFSEETHNTSTMLSSNVTTVDRSLKNEIQKAKLDLSNQIRGNVSEISRQLSALENGLTEQNNHISNIMERVDGLNDTVRSNVSLYRDCFDQTVSCSILPVTEVTYYWRLCSTSYVPFDFEGYKMTDMHCEYQSVYLGFHVSSVLDKRQTSGVNTARCRCSVLSPHITDGYLLQLPSSLSASCTLVITQCPTQQQLYN